MSSYMLWIRSLLSLQPLYATFSIEEKSQFKDLKNLASVVNFFAGFSYFLG